MFTEIFKVFFFIGVSVSIVASPKGLAKNVHASASDIHKFF